ncbi:MAG: hypothetical protein AAGD25_14750 [Cyanobacteria bacterium P01_F01_bin.150]
MGHPSDLDSVPTYSSLGQAIRGVCLTWCEENGYCDPFCQDGEWWAFPINGVMPIRIKTVMGEECPRMVKIGPALLKLLPDGSVG